MNWKSKLVIVCLFGIITSCMEENKGNIAIISTDLGDMEIELFDNTPLHRDNFIKLTNDKFYDDLLFHRVIPNFMCQGGDPKSRGAASGQNLGAGGPGYTIPAEFTPSNIHLRGAIAAARRGGSANPTKASSGSQFYVVTGREVRKEDLDAIESRGNLSYTEEQRELYYTHGGYPGLDGDYTVFGQVLSGMETLEKMSALPTNPSNRPDKDVTMKIRMK